jgi:hypothetical protein
MAAAAAVQHQQAHLLPTLLLLLVRLIFCVADGDTLPHCGFSMLFSRNCFLQRKLPQWLSVQTEDNLC